MSGEMKGKFITAGLILFLTGTGFTFGGWQNQFIKGNHQLQDGQVALAIDAYKGALAKAPKKAEVHYNLGEALYQAKNYAEAHQHFSETEQLTKDKHLQQRTNYNLGNTQYREGEAQLQTNPEEAIKNLQSALDTYKKALKADPTDQDAKFNYEFVKKKLDELKQQQKNQKNQQNQKDSEDQNDQKDKNGQNKDQNDNQQDKNDQSKKNDQNKQNDQSKENDQNKQNNQNSKDQNKQNSADNQSKANQQNQGQDKQQNANNTQQNGKENNQGSQEQANAQEPVEGDKAGMTKEQALQLLQQFKNQGNDLIPLQIGEGQAHHSSKDW